ncbi:hypothetical protein B0H63DRAFT_447998 [Podospora didyma]|uniref:Uncharacterized protein n=1 Tax=Podospora didyma TaxID=330526 RepID=A0AAE0U168_9PEZI|nr:hypothetical protein B0H63DRAFT_447998 [Podospora didyma]
MSMYGSYGSSSSSYSSYTSSYGSYSISSPMDIAPSRFSSRAADASCAFPSWPRRSSLSESDSEDRATSYLSDEDLYLQDVFEDDAQSVSSHGSASPIQSPQMPAMTEAEILQAQREQAAYQREVMRFIMSEKEKRRQAAKRQRRSSTSSSSGKKSKSKLSAMTPIAEAE